MDLTARRLKLFNEARSKIDAAQRGFYGDDISHLNDADKVFAFVDENCRLRVRAGEDLFTFNTKKQFDKIFVDIYEE